MPLPEIPKPNTTLEALRGLRWLFQDQSVWIQRSYFRKAMGNPKLGITEMCPYGDSPDHCCLVGGVTHILGGKEGGEEFTAICQTLYEVIDEHYAEEFAEELEVEDGILPEFNDSLPSHEELLRFLDLAIEKEIQRT